MGNNRIPLETDTYYHIYNHANGKENLFLSDDNFLFFLEKYKQHITPVADTYAYCLMPNHFHFVVRIKSGPFSIKNKQGIESTESLTLKEVSNFLSQTFGNLFNSYAKAFNKQQGRKGKLFLDNFERRHINSEDYFRNVIHYVHYNPVYHGFVAELTDWQYSSFETYLTNEPTDIKRDEVFNLFDSRKNFLAFHRRKTDEDLGDELEG